MKAEKIIVKPKPKPKPMKKLKKLPRKVVVKPYTVAEAMERLAVNQSTIYKFMSDGCFEWQKVGRFREIDRATFDAFAKSYTKWDKTK
jgi:excisionase family DNA binding protein